MNFVRAQCALKCLFLRLSVTLGGLGLHRVVEETQEEVGSVTHPEDVVLRIDLGIVLGYVEVLLSCLRVDATVQLQALFGRLIRQTRGDLSQESTMLVRPSTRTLS